MITFSFDLWIMCQGVCNFSHIYIYFQNWRVNALLIRFNNIMQEKAVKT